MRVLLVDDDPGYRAFVRITIEEALPAAEIVAEASDGDEAVELALEHKPDLIFIDFAMPRMDGAAATLAIKHALPDVKVVMFSGSERSHEAAAVTEVRLIRKSALNVDTIRAALA